RMKKSVADVIKYFQLDDANDVIQLIENHIEHLKDELRRYDYPWKYNDMECPFETLGQFEKLADALVAGRLRLGLNQTEFAKIVNISPQQLSRYEKNQYKAISVERAIALARCLREVRERRKPATGVKPEVRTD